MAPSVCGQWRTGSGRQDYNYATDSSSYDSSALLLSYTDLLIKLKAPMVAVSKGAKGNAKCN